MQTSISFPTTSRARPETATGSTLQSNWRVDAANNNVRTVSIASHSREVALEVHDLVYGPHGHTPASVSQNIGGTSAPAAPNLSGAMSEDAIIMANLERLYEPNAVYENPLLTATTREMILDIHHLSRQIADVHVSRPRPLRMLAWLFGWRQAKTRGAEVQVEAEEPPWFDALKCWSELGDIVAESEGWDGTRRSVIEHTLHILFLPNLHSFVPGNSTEAQRASLSPSTSSLSFHGSASTPPHHVSSPALHLGGIFTLPSSPLHLQLRIITKLTFNEQGRVSYHRDFWDARDLIRMLPGGRPAMWVWTRLVARGLSTVSWLFTPRSSSTNVDYATSRSGEEEINPAYMSRRRSSVGAASIHDAYPSGPPIRRTPSALTHEDALGALGLVNINRRKRSISGLTMGGDRRARAPDIDPDAMQSNW